MLCWDSHWRTKRIIWRSIKVPRKSRSWNKYGSSWTETVVSSQDRTYARLTTQDATHGFRGKRGKVTIHSSGYRTTTAPVLSIRFPISQAPAGAWRICLALSEDRGSCRSLISYEKNGWMDYFHIFFLYSDVAPRGYLHRQSLRGTKSNGFCPREVPPFVRKTNGEWPRCGPDWRCVWFKAIKVRRKCLWL